MGKQEQTKKTTKATKSSTKNTTKVTKVTGAVGSSVAPEEDGNETSSSKRSNGCIHWSCRLSLKDGSKSSIDSWIREHCSSAVYQAEKGEETGYLHWQINLRLKKKQRGEWLKRHFHANLFVEPSRNIEAAANYCMKKETCIEGPYIYPEPVDVILDPMDDHEFKPWQTDVINIIKQKLGAENRKINWYWSHKGEMGKSNLVKHLALKHGAYCMGGKASDVFFALQKQPKILVCDVARTKEKHFHPWEWIEGCLNGAVFSPKYESGMKLFNPPHIFVFCNFEPEKLDVVSLDRWNIVNVDEPDQTDVSGNTNETIYKDNLNERIDLAVSEIRTKASSDVSK